MRGALEDSYQEYHRAGATVGEGREGGHQWAVGRGSPCRSVIGHILCMSDKGWEGGHQWAIG